jgi:Alkylmercury lyase
MQLTVLAVPGCPNAAVLDDRLTAVLRDRAGASVSHEVISDHGDAQRWGMHGSPTLLIDGVDPFAEPGQAPSMACRLYQDEDGQPTGAPSMGQLQRVIDRAVARSTERSDQAWLDSLGRDDRGRVAPAERGLRAVHQAVLRSFVNSGAPPSITGLAEHAAPFDVAAVLAELAGGDFLYLSRDGQITAAYPFSALPTRHIVRISESATVFSMCAIDALGISAMTGLPVVIESADPSTGEPVTVHVDGASSSWNPATAVVYVGYTGSQCDGPSASVCCGYMNFFATWASASAWAASHPEIRGGILSQDRALQIGIGIFGQLLRQPTPDMLAPPDRGTAATRPRAVSWPVATTDPLLVRPFEAGTLSRRMA